MQKARTLSTQELADKSKQYKEAILKGDAKSAEYEAFILFNQEILYRMWEADVEFYVPYE